MSVSSVGLEQAVGTSGLRSSVREANQDFDQLFQSLQSGNLGAAQQAYSSFQQIQARLTGTATTQPGAVSTATAANSVASDWSAVGQALQSGSLTSAREAFGKLQQDAQSAWQSQFQQQVQNAKSVYELMQSTQGTVAPSGTASTGNLSAADSAKRDLNALTLALQSTDSSEVEKLLAQLQKDLQALGETSGQTNGTHYRHHHHGGFSDTSASSGYQTTPASGSTPAGAASATSSSGVSAKA
ncbi:MAG: hypothetical protein NT123_22565 [Proteobacteria bacterium]|nr:hypothetical protein [Pseudomonadota bacterium]